MKRLIYHNLQAENHAIAIRAVDDGAPLVNGKIYEVDNAITGDLLATGFFFDVDAPVERAELTGVDGISDELAEALAYVGVINRADLRAEFERDDGARLLQVPGIGKARLSALREWAQGE